MQIRYKKQELFYEFPFTTSRETKTSFTTILIGIDHIFNGRSYTGYGEAVPPHYYDETPETVIRFFDQLNEQNVLDGTDPFNMQDFELRMTAFKNNFAAKAALDMALYDLRGKLLNMPLYKLWGLDPAKAPDTSYTIGLGSTKEVIKKTTTALEGGYTILKVKTGTKEDLKLLQAIRKLAPDATIRVDANTGWALKEAIELLPIFDDLNIELIEEPLHLDEPLENYLRLKEKTAIPVMADERCHRLHDIPKCARYFDAVNLKLPKTGGLSEALRMIHAAKAHNLKVMLGCMAETSLSITAFAHLSPLADYADLDGNLIMINDPFEKVQVKNRIVLRDEAGIGEFKFKV